MFSIPLNPKLNQNQFNIFLKFLEDHKSLIYDVYFTCRIPPFLQDAMGDIFLNDPDDLIENAFVIQDKLGIRISATFNNIQVAPTQQNLDLFVGNLERLYKRGLRSCTVPHTHWIMTGQLQKACPEMEFKNTILRELNTAADVAKQAEAGFAYINIDRDLMRDRDTLEKIKRVKEKYGIKIALLANEGCVGSCPVMSEHFQFNNMRDTTPQYFTDPISRVSCPRWDIKDPSTPLKTANIPPWREDWIELLEYVDIFKMHGRESLEQIFSTMNIIHRYSVNEEILYDEFNGYLENTNLKGKPINAWREFIKNCKFDCWDCNKCDKLYEAKNGKKQETITDVIVDTILDSVNTNPLYIDIPGLTSARVQQLINQLCKNAETYLEVGSFLGATAAAAVKNPITAYCVDNWKDNIYAAKEEYNSLPDNNKEMFINNIKFFKHPDAKTHIFDCDLFDVDKSEIKPIDIFFYDGPHDLETTARAVEYYADVLSDISILIFDDANFDGVVEGARKGITNANLTVHYDRIILNELESASGWWNGLYIVLVGKLET
tara:strand:- start:1018 stop:2658 length:1641 start_codon:yes stop_codon:yes gene_type:complete